MDPVGARDERDVDVVVDYEKRTGLDRHVTKTACHIQQLPARQLLVAQLKDVCASPQHRLRESYDLFRITIGGDGVEAGGFDQVRIWRSFSRRASGALSCSQQTLTSRFSEAWNS